MKKLTCLCLFNFNPLCINPSAVNIVPIREVFRDWATVKSAIKNDLSGYLFKTTKRNPMILPVITEI